MLERPHLPKKPDRIERHRQFGDALAHGGGRPRVRHQPLARGPRRVVALARPGNPCRGCASARDWPEGRFSAPSLPRLRRALTGRAGRSDRAQTPQLVRCLVQQAIHRGPQVQIEKIERCFKPGLYPATWRPLYALASQAPKVVSWRGIPRRLIIGTAWSGDILSPWRRPDRRPKATSAPPRDRSGPRRDRSRTCPEVALRLPPTPPRPRKASERFADGRGCDAKRTLICCSSSLGC